MGRVFTLPHGTVDVCDSRSWCCLVCALWCCWRFLLDLQGLLSLRRLDVSGNQLRRIEVLAACRELTLFTDLHVAANPLVAAQDMRLHVVRLLTQVSWCCCNGVVERNKPANSFLGFLNAVFNQT